MTVHLLPITVHSLPLQTPRMNLVRRPRRLRATPQLRALVREVTLTKDDFILPLFARPGTGAPGPILGTILKSRPVASPPRSLATSDCYPQRYPEPISQQKSRPEERLKALILLHEPYWIRTSDPLLKRQMLYRLS